MFNIANYVLFDEEDIYLVLSGKKCRSKSRRSQTKILTIRISHGVSSTSIYLTNHFTDVRGFSQTRMTNFCFLIISSTMSSSEIVGTWNLVAFSLVFKTKDWVSFKNEAVSFWRCFSADDTMTEYLFISCGSLKYGMFTGYRKGFLIIMCKMPFHF